MLPEIETEEIFEGRINNGASGNLLDWNGKEKELILTNENGNERNVERYRMWMDAAAVRPWRDTWGGSYCNIRFLVNT